MLSEPDSESEAFFTIFQKVLQDQTGIHKQGTASEVKTIVLPTSLPNTYIVLLILKG